MRERERREERYRKPLADSARVRLVPELAARMRMWLALNGRDWKYYGRKIGLEGLMASLLADFLDSDGATQARTLARGIERAERHEKAWNEEIARKVASGELVVDDSNNPVPPPRPRKPKQQAQQPQLPLNGHDASVGHGARRPTPKPGRKRA
jgi:hypothetical protein